MDDEYKSTISGSTDDEAQVTLSKAETIAIQRAITLNEAAEKKSTKESGSASKTLIIFAVVFSILFSLTCGSLAGYFAAKSYFAKEGLGNSTVLYTSVIRNVSDSEEVASPLTNEQTVALTGNSVVEIRTEVISTGTLMSQYVSEGAGSGVVISENGYIATNYHVIEDATTINVTMKNGESYTAEIIAGDAEADIAVLKIDADNLNPVIFADSDKITVGEEVIAIGNPLGELGGTVTKGIISALDREITIDNQIMTLLQFDAAINPGNSGGGLFNCYGELIGIVNAKSYGSEIDGLGFAIPANTAKAAISDLVEYGYIRGRVRLGITMIDVTSQRYCLYYGVSEPGVYIYSINSGSLAEKAGLKRGDRILSVNGSEISTSSDVSSLIKTSSVGDEITLKIKRENSELTLSVTAAEYIPGK